MTSKWELSVSHRSSSENVLPRSCSRLFASVRQDSDALLIFEANHQTSLVSCEVSLGDLSGLGRRESTERRTGTPIRPSGKLTATRFTRVSSVGLNCPSYVKQETIGTHFWECWFTSRRRDSRYDGQYWNVVWKCVSPHPVS